MNRKKRRLEGWFFKKKLFSSSYLPVKSSDLVHGVLRVAGELGCGRFWGISWCESPISFAKVGEDEAAP
jgi:hypothetical protein